MKKPIVLLVLGPISIGMVAFLPGCGQPAASEQNVAIPNTAPLIQDTAPTTPFPSDLSPTPSPVSDGPVAKPVSPPVPPVLPVVTSPSSVVASLAPSPAPAADDALEFVPTDSHVSAARDGGITVVEKVEEKTSKKEEPSARTVQGESYTWEDGDRTLTVYLQSDLLVEKRSDGVPGDIVEAADDADTAVVRGEGRQTPSDTLPVFRSESGSLMTLPGGVLLVLNAEWTQAETNTFFSNNGIKMERVSELIYAPNGFFIDTEPGFPSLELANELAVLNGVEVSSPNWNREMVPR